jgi:drug/metabolite transporter (DMT)-like permease
MSEPDEPEPRALGATTGGAAASASTPPGAPTPPDAPAPARAATPPQGAAVDPRTTFLTVAAFAAVYVIWGSTYFAIRIGIETIPPFFLAGSRFLVAGALLYAFVRRRAGGAPSGRDWLHAGVSGLLMLTAGNGIVTWAEKSVPSNVAALLVSAGPVYLALLEWARPGGRRPSLLVWAGIGLGAAGLALLVGPGRAEVRASAHGAEAPSLGAVLAILWASFSFCLGTMYARYVGKPRNGPAASAQQMIVGGAALLALSALGREPVAAALPEVSLRSALAYVYLMLFGSIVAYSAYGYLVKASTPVRLGTIAYVNPLVAVLLGWGLLDEALGPRGLLGALAILLAVIVMTAGPAWLGRSEARPATTRAP